MTVETPPSLQMEATTETGRGLLVPIAKALSHLMLMHSAIRREWPLSGDSARTEIAEAVRHLSDMVVPSDLISEELQLELTNWTTELSGSSTVLAAEVVTDPDAPLSEARVDTLRQLISNTWRLLALIDLELTGLRPADVDPGTLP